MRISPWGFRSEIMSHIVEEKFQGLLYLEGHHYRDERGSLEKPLYDGIIPGLMVDEVYYIRSKKNVLRGLHFQLAPFAQGKFISVVRGRILDVVVDLRPHSPTCGEHVSYVLSEGDHRALYVPPGLAHGYLTLEDESLILYVQSGKYAPEAERGIRYDSFGMDWGVSVPQLSQKDLGLPSLAEYLTRRESR